MGHPLKHVRFDSPQKPMPFVYKSWIPDQIQHDTFKQIYQGSDELNVSIFDNEMSSRASPDCGEPRINKSPLHQISPMNRLVSENDLPCTLGVKQTPAPNIYHQNQSGNVYKMTDENSWNMMKKSDDQGFFTLPNSASKFSMENNLQPYKENIIPRENQSMISPARLTDKPCIEKRQFKKSNCQKKTRQNKCQCRCVPDVDDDDEDICRCKNCRPKHDALQKRDDSKPSVSDLYNIVKIQNERMNEIQNRLHDLQTGLSRLLNAKQTDADVTHNSINQRQIQYPENDKPADNETHKISIGVMTSFEVVMTSKSVKESQNCVDECVQTSRIKNSEIITSRVFTENCQRSVRQMNFLDGIKRYNKNDDDENVKPIKSHRGKNRRIKNDDFDLVETDSLMMKLRQSKSPPVSPQPTMNLNYQDYSDSEDECSRPGVGWTFYNNCMNHVNQILCSPPEVHDAKFSNMKMNRYKRTEVGSNENNTSKKVTFGADDAMRVTSSKERYMSETSLHMNNLAAKYLNTNERYENRTIPLRNITNPTHPECLPNEMSFSTHQYMQKHHLLSVPHDVENYPKYPKTKKNPIEQRLPRYVTPTRILDITAIKQQPKLL